VVVHDRELGVLGARSKALAASCAGGEHALIADDDRAVQRLVERWLNGAGYSVVTCDRFNAAMARELLK
jgi:hypothetical protein